MRRFATVLIVLAVVGVGLAALINALVDSEASTGDGAATRSAPSGTAAVATEPAPPDCGEDQLALAFEKLGGGDAVALRHVKGEPCRVSGVTLQITVVDREGRLSGIPLGDEADLSGDYPPGFERVAFFNACKGKGVLVATATAGPYSANSRIQPGAAPCIDAVQRRIVRLGGGRASAAVYVQALDPATHTFSVRMTIPRSARVRVDLETASGLRIRVLDSGRRHDFCDQRQGSEVCTVPFPLLETERAGGWTVWVRKSSAAPTRIPLSISFEPVGQ
ncbi:MAG TPA: hypothetical protein VFK17_00315 [Gaiellaceae bacterium]|jgi:hypothetical protein|nr:hypothetical protein [Gaiellaceae bacterium]